MKSVSGSVAVLNSRRLLAFYLSTQKCTPPLPWQGSSKRVFVVTSNDELCFTRPDSPSVKRSRVDDDDDESVSGGRLGVPPPDSIRVTQVSIWSRTRNDTSHE